MNGDPGKEPEAGGAPGTGIRVPLRFGESYREEARTTDGTPLVLRALLPSDRELMRRGFERLSPESRYLRFFTVKQELTDEEVRYLTEVDGIDHYAITAVMAGPDGTEESAGIARFIRAPENAQVAEPAVAVIDEMHGKGIGTLLLIRIAAAAYERGIRRFRFEVLTSNRPIRHLLDEVGYDAEIEYVGLGVLRVDLPIPQRVYEKRTIESIIGSGIYRLLAGSAREAVSIRHPDGPPPRARR